MSRRAILITGGARRVGGALSRFFVRHGYDIALHYYHSQGEASALKKEIESGGGVCELFSHDLGDTKGIAALVKQVHKTMPYCGALINNASIFERVNFMDTDEALFDRQMTINFKAPFFMTQAFAGIFGKGCVVNILDTDITQTHGSHFAYLLSKKALAEFTVMAARELGPDIRVNGVCPGYIMPATADEAFADEAKNKVPLKHHASAEDVAEAARWLITQPNITGQLMYVDGGKHVL